MSSSRPVLRCPPVPDECWEMPRYASGQAIRAIEKDAAYIVEFRPDAFPTFRIRCAALFQALGERRISSELRDFPFNSP